MVKPNAYAIYLRKSRKDEYNESVEDVLERHRTTLTALADQMNLPVVKIYQEVVSGETIAGRPEIQNLLRDVEQNLYAGVIVMEIERLARGDAIDQGIIQRTFFVTETKIVTPMKIYDPANEFDEEYFEYGLYRSRSEYKTIRRRIHAGRIHSVMEGKWIASTAPYGYERIKLERERGYTLKIIEDEAEVIRLIFDLYVNGKDAEVFGANKISKYLDALGIKPKKNDYWSAATIRDILKNPTYMGKVSWGREKDVKSVENGEIITHRIRQADYMLYDGRHEAIISEETYRTAQSLLKSHTKPSTRPNTELVNPLSGLVYCEKCGRLMTRLGPNKKNRYSTLRCMNKYCDNISAPIYSIEDEIVQFLREWLDQEQLIFEKKELKQEPESAQILSKQIENIRLNVAELKSQLDKTYDLLERGLYSEEIFLQRNKKLTKQIKEQETHADELQDTLTTVLENHKRMNVWFPQTMKLIESYDINDAPEFRNSILKQLIQKVTYLKTEKNHRGTVDNRNFQLNIIPKLPHMSESDT